MSKVRIYGDISGYVDIAVPDNAGTTTLNLDKVPQADLSGNVAIDTDTLYVDAANNRVGIGTTTPARKLTVRGSNNTTNFEVTDGAGGATFNIYNSTTSNAVALGTSSDLMSFGFNGIDKVHFKSNGNVGIGTNNPNTTLDIVSPSTGEAVHVRGRSADDIGQIVFNENDGVTRLARLDARQGFFDVASSSVLYLSAGGVGNRNIVVLSNGNVGIGNENPPALLTLGKSVNTYEDLLMITNYGSDSDPVAAIGFDQTNDRLIIRNDQSYAAGGIGFRAGGSINHMFIESISGNVGIGTDDPLRKIHIQDSGDTHIVLQTTSATDNYEIFEIGVGANASNQADLTFRTRDNNGTGGIEVMRLTNNGKVGINNSSPDRELDVKAVDAWAELALRGNAGSGSIEFYTGVTTKLAEIFADSSDIVFRNTASNTERMRILGSGPITQASQPSFSAYRTTSQAVSGQTTFVFNTTLHNIGNHYNTSTGEFTAPVSGTYIFSFKSLLYSMGTGEWFDLYPQVNNVNRKRYELTGNGGFHTQVDYTEAVYLNANDTFRMTGSDRSTGSYSLYGNENHFSGYLLG